MGKKMLRGLFIHFKDYFLVTVVPGQNKGKDSDISFQFSLFSIDPPFPPILLYWSLWLISFYEMMRNKDSIVQRHSSGTLNKKCVEKKIIYPDQV